MMKKEKSLKLAVSSILVLAALSAGIGLYRGNDKSEENEQARIQQEEQKQDEKKHTKSESAATPNARAKDFNDTEHEEKKAAGDKKTEETNAQGEKKVLPELAFDGKTKAKWPVEGDVAIDYSMDAAVYFPTLEVYKYNPALILKAEENQQVQAASASKVLSVTENAETGVTVMMDMGNGYQATYGQLQNVSVKPGQTVDAGTVIGSIAPPTKYYSVEGGNLYFAMTKDGKAVDPKDYMEDKEQKEK